MMILSGEHEWRRRRTTTCQLLCPPFRPKEEADSLPPLRTQRPPHGPIVPESIYPPSHC